MYYYKTVPVTAAAGAENLEIGITSTPERHVVVDAVTTKPTSNVRLVLSFEREEICNFDSEVIEQYRNGIPVDLDIPEGDIFYVGIENKASAEVTQNIVIQYHLK